ncbi:unnamed protein product [Boreogadus saida]
MADLFGEIMGEAAAMKGIPMPAPPLAPMSDDMQGECFRTLSSSRRVTQCPLFPPVQHLFTAAGGDPSTLKAPRQIAGLTDRVFVCASQSAAAVNNITLLSSALVSLSSGREHYGPEEAARWLAVSRSPAPSFSCASRLWKVRRRVCALWLQPADNARSTHECYA